jgi:hypothetical protein
MLSTIVTNSLAGICSRIVPSMWSHSSAISSMRVPVRARA